jgi:hypothetical protein
MIKKFVPSWHLTLLFRQYCIKPDKEILNIFDATPNQLDIIKNIEQIIVKELEGLCTSMAKEAYRIKQSVVKLTEDLMFIFKVCTELVSRLGLDTSRCLMVFLGKLREEFWVFLAGNTQQKPWGKIEIVDNEIVLILNEHVACWEPDFLEKYVEDFFKEIA